MEDSIFAPAPTNDKFWHPGLKASNTPAIAPAPTTPSLAKQHHIAWLCGPAGCGKSAVSQTIAEEAERRGCLGASFFFSGDSADRSGFNRVAITLASQLAEAIPATRRHIEAALRASPNLDAISVASQFERLIYRPLQSAVGTGTLPTVKRRSPAGWLVDYVKPFLIVIDGLDECNDHEAVRDFLQHMIEFFKKGHNPRVPLRILISSRVNLVHIREAIDTDRVTILDLGNQDSRKDVEMVVRHAFRAASTRSSVIHSYGEEWPLEHDVQSLIDRSGGSLSFITTVLDYILGLDALSDDGLPPKERLDLALSMDPSILAH